MEALNSPGIYRLIFPDGSYVGQTKNVRSRLRQHFSKINDGIHPNFKIRSGVKRFGKPSVEVLEYCSLEELNAREIHWMEVYDCFPAGYNLKAGGDYPRDIVAQKEIILAPDVPGLSPYIIFLGPIIIGIIASFFIPGSLAILLAVASYLLFLSTSWL